MNTEEKIQDITAEQKSTELDFYPLNYKDGEILVNENCVVIRASFGHLCGYVFYSKDEIPSDWHCNYDAPGLQLLNIHKGITYAEVNCSDKEKEQEARQEFFNKKTELLMLYNMDPSMNYLGELTDLHKGLSKKRMAGGYDYVIFGFDCAHYMDNENPLLKDMNHVMELTKQMDKQLRAFSKAYEYYKGSDDQDEKYMIIEMIRNDADHMTEIGLGGMLNILRDNE